MTVSLLMMKEQHNNFDLHTGSCSNTKLIQLAIINYSIGDYYFIEINVETFTRLPRSANATSELFRTKEKRLVSWNETENHEDINLQVALFKKIADGYDGPLKARELYVESTESRFSFVLNERVIMNQPSAYGGIGRRIGKIYYPVKFIANTEPNNQNDLRWLNTKANN
jgi:hypothetical protein